MLVGAGKIILDFYGNDKVAVKQRNIKELCDSVRKKFNLSSLEIDDFDDPERCVIGFATVIPEKWGAKKSRNLMDQICKEFDTTAFARVTLEDWDLLGFE